MKFLKTHFFLFIILATLVTVSGCHYVPFTYTLNQPPEQVAKIEICRFDYESKSVISLKNLNKEEMSDILTDISELISYRHFGDGPTSYGEVIIYITYADNTAEVLGVFNTGIVDADGVWHLKIEYFEKVGFSKMILKYIDEDLVPEVYRKWAV